MMGDSPVNKHLKYAAYIWRHKRYVYQEGRRLGIGRLRLLIHDWHKLLPVEWFPYVETFYGSGAASFDYAWNHHQKLAPHHWQYWVMPLDDGGFKVLEMPEKYRVEMIADWRGAGRAIKGHGPEKVPQETRSWYRANRENMQLHPETRAAVERDLLWVDSDRAAPTASSRATPTA